VSKIDANYLVEGPGRLIFVLSGVVTVWFLANYRLVELNF